MAGLETISAITSRVGWVLAAPPVCWDLPSVEPFAVAGYECGVAWTVTRRSGRVIATAIAEAGAAFIVELDPADAMTIAALSAAEGT